MGAGGVVQRFATHQFVQGQLGAAVVVQAGGGAKSRGVRQELAHGRLGGGRLAVHRGQEVADGLVQVEQAVMMGAADQGPGRDDLGQRGDVVRRVPGGCLVAALRGDDTGAEKFRGAVRGAVDDHAAGGGAVGDDGLEGLLEAGGVSGGERDGHQGPPGMMVVSAPSVARLDSRCP